MSRRLIGACALLILAITSCSAHPLMRASQVCSDCKPTVLQRATSMPLQSYWRNIPGRQARLHIYLEGDGRPWIEGRQPANNPSSTRLTALSLMHKDPNPAVYINRPCYGVSVQPRACHPRLWTSARYSEPVVQALNAAVSEAKAQVRATELILIGHSGGGSLAMLIAARRQDVVAVITLGANLDTLSWTDHFGYLPLTESLNPAELEPLPADVLRWHFAGAQDQQVPPAITEGVAKADPRARFILLPQVDHQAGWREHWPLILDELEAALGVQDSLAPAPTGTK